MIAFMRKIVHSKIYRFFLWLFVFVMIFGGGLAIMNKTEHKNWIMKIYKQTLSAEQFSNIKSRVQQQQQAYQQKGLLKQDVDVNQQALQAAVVSLLSEHAADQIDLQIPEDQIEKYMNQKLQQIAPQFIDAHGKVNMQALRSALGMHNIHDFLSEIEQELKNFVLYGLIDFSVYVANFQTVLAYKAEIADKKYSYFILPTSKYIAKAQQQSVSEDALYQFYKRPEIANQFRIAEKRSGVLWSFNAQDFVAQPTQAEIKALYDKQKASRYVAQPATMQVRSLLVKIDKDESSARQAIQEIHQTAMQDPSKFEKLVREFSQDSKAAQHGGLSEFFNKDDKKLDNAVVQTAFEHLHEDGQMSVPLKTNRGFEIIQRVKKNNPTYKDLKSVEAEIKQELINEKFKKRFAQDAGRVVTGAKYNPESLKKFIARYHGTESKLPLDVKKSGFESSHLFRIEQGRYTSFIHKDKGYILLCDHAEKSKLPALEQVRAKVTELYFKEQAEKMIKQDLKNAYQLAKDMSFSAVAEKYGVAVQAASFTFKDGVVDQSPVLKDQNVAFKIHSVPCVGATLASETDKGGMLLHVDQVALINDALFYSQKEALNQVLYYLKMYQIKDAFIASLYRTAKLNNKIEIQKELLQNIKEV